MPNWKTLLDEVKASGTVYDRARRKYLIELCKVTNRNVITYYSAWLQKPELTRQGISGFSIDDSDKNGFMAVIHQLDRTKGLDLILHTPGGDVSATESLVDYLRSMFDDIRAIIPHMSMSAGTMIAFACRQIIMGKHSNIGPIDPQVWGMPAHGVLEEFEQAKQDVLANPALISVWQPILSKYPPTLIGECRRAIQWADSMVTEWLKTGMFVNDRDPQGRAERAVHALGNQQITLTHARHISFDGAKNAGLEVVRLEDDPGLQEAVLSVHHATVLTLASTDVLKIIENQNGITFAQGVEARYL